MTITEIIERLDLTASGAKHVLQFGGEVDAALAADDPAYEPFLTADRIAVLKALVTELQTYRAQCAEALAVTTPKKAKKEK